MKRFICSAPQSGCSHCLTCRTARPEVSPRLQALVSSRVCQESARQRHSCTLSGGRQDRAAVVDVADAQDAGQVVVGEEGQAPGVHLLRLEGVRVLGQPQRLQPGPGARLRLPARLPAARHGAHVSGEGGRASRGLGAPGATRNNRHAPTIATIRRLCARAGPLPACDYLYGTGCTHATTRTSTTTGTSPRKGWLLRTRAPLQPAAPEQWRLYISVVAGRGTVSPTGVETRPPAPAPRPAPPALRARAPS